MSEADLNSFIPMFQHGPCPTCGVCRCCGTQELSCSFDFGQDLISEDQQLLDWADSNGHYSMSYGSLREELRDRGRKDQQKEE